MRLKGVCENFILLVALGLIGLFIHLGWICYVADSEIWSVTLANHFVEEIQHYWMLTRPLFYFLLHLVQLPFDASVELILVSRVLFIINGLLIVGLTFRVARRFTGEATLGILAVVLLLSHTGFLNQGFRIRSDLLAATVGLWALDVIIAKRSAPRVLGQLSLLLLATPKAALYIIAYLAFLPQGTLARLRQKLARRPYQKMSVAVAAAGLAGLGLLWPVYDDNWNYFLNSFRGEPGMPPYFSESSFQFLSRWIERNPIFTGLFFLRIGTYLMRQRRKAFASDEQQWWHERFFYFTMANLSVMILAPEKVPFFLASFLPVFSMFAALFVDDLSALPSLWAVRSAYWRRLGMAALIGLVTAVWIHGMLFYRENAEFNNNSPQKQAIESLEEYLRDYPEASVYDIIGIRPRRATLRLFAGPNQFRFNRLTARRIGELQPDFILYVSKATFLEPELSALLASAYFNFGQGVFAKAISFPEPIKVTAKSGKTLEDALTEVFKHGAPATGRQQTLKVRDREGGLELITGTAESLISELMSRAKIWKKPVEILAVSQFLPPRTVLPSNLAAIFRFDSDF